MVNINAALCRSRWMNELEPCSNALTVLLCSWRPPFAIETREMQINARHEGAMCVRRRPACSWCDGQERTFFTENKHTIDDRVAGLRNRPQHLLNRLIMNNNNNLCTIAAARVKEMARKIANWFIKLLIAGAVATAAAAIKWNQLLNTFFFLLRFIFICFVFFRFVYIFQIPIADILIE